MPLAGLSDRLPRRTKFPGNHRNCDWDAVCEAGAVFISVRSIINIGLRQSRYVLFTDLFGQIGK